MNFRYFFISIALGATVFPQAFHPLLAQESRDNNAPAAQDNEIPAEHDAAQYEADLMNCTPSSHVLPSLLGDLAGIELVNLAYIRGYEDENCLVDYIFADPEQPQMEATYLSCAYPPETIEQIVTSDESGEMVDISDECVFNENWASELGLFQE
jgi:hypothetical protein